MTIVRERITKSLRSGGALRDLLESALGRLAHGIDRPPMTRLPAPLAVVGANATPPPGLSLRVTALRS